jgi:hypothetical protein
MRDIFLSFSKIYEIQSCIFFKIYSLSTMNLHLGISSSILLFPVHFIILLNNVHCMSQIYIFTHLYK